MSEGPLFNILSFEKLRERKAASPIGDYYEPTWDQGKGVVRLGTIWSKRLEAQRGDFVRVSNARKSATYTLKLSEFLDADDMALDYDQQRQLGLLNGPGPVALTIRKVRWGTFSFLWKHVDPAIRLPFQISIWMACLGLIAGALLGASLDFFWR